MPKKKSESYKPRVYTKKQGKHRVHYVEYYLGSKRKFERSHKDKCFCGKPKPNRPCEHLAAAQEMLKTFEHKLFGTSFDAPIAYIIEQWWLTNDPEARTEKTISLYAQSFRLFQAFCDAHRYELTSDLLKEPGDTSMARFKRWMQEQTYSTRCHTKESRHILRKIDYRVRRDGISRKDPAYQSPAYQELIKQMEDLMIIHQEKYSPASISRVLRDLRVLFKFAVYMGLMPRNPLEEANKPKSMRLIAVPRNQQARRETLTSEERARLLEGTRGDTYDMAVVYLYAGLRLGELINLTWSDHIREDHIHIKATCTWTPKWGKERFIPIHPLVKEVLQRRRKEMDNKRYSKSSYVFWTDGRKGYPVPFSERNVQQRFQRVFAKLGIKGSDGQGVSIHSLRHSFVSELIKAGENLVKVQAIAGHQDIRTTMGYAHVIDATKSDALMSMA